MEKNKLNKKLNLIFDNKEELSKWKIELFESQILEMESYFDYLSNELKWIFIESNNESFKNINVINLINRRSSELIELEKTIIIAKSNLKYIIEHDIEININILIDISDKGFKYIKDSIISDYPLCKENFLSYRERDINEVDIIEYIKNKFN